MQYIPAALPSPIAIGLQQLMQGAMQGRMVDRQKKNEQTDLQLLQNLINPEMNQLNAQQRFAQGLPLLQGQSNQYTGEAGPALLPGQVPNFQTPKYRDFFAQQQLQQFNPQYQAQLANLQSSTDVNQARAQDLRRGPIPQKIPVNEQLHNYALNQGFAPGTKEYDNITRGLKTEPKESISDLKVGIIKKMQKGETVPGFEGMTPAEILKLDGTTITNTFNTGKIMTEGMIDRQSKKKAFMDTAKATYDLWDKSYTGPIEGRVTWLKNRIAGGTKDSAKFEAGVASVLESMYQRAGKQLSDTEIAKWKPFLPKITDPDKTFAGKWENLVDNVSTYLASEESLASAAGYNIPGQDIGQKQSTQTQKELSFDEFRALDKAAQDKYLAERDL